MRTSTVVLLVSVFCQPLLLAQQVFIVGKGGVSSYSSVYFNIAGSGGDENWKSGHQVGKQ